MNAELISFEFIIAASIALYISIFLIKNTLYRYNNSGVFCLENFQIKTQSKAVLSNTNGISVEQKSSNVIHLFLAAVRNNNTSVAIVDKERKITYEVLKKNIEASAFKYQKAGIKKGDRVMVFVPMSIELYQTILALFYLGAVPVFVDEWSSLKRLNHAAQLVNCKAFISNTKGRVFSWFVKELRSIPVKISPSVKPFTNAKIQIANVSDTDDAVITLSTGSTGVPKAAIRSHKMLNSQFQSLKSYMLTDASQSDMTSLPIVLLINLGLGKTAIIPDTNLRKLYCMHAPNVYHQIKKHEVKSISSSPNFMIKLSQFKAQIKNPNDQVEHIIIGGAPCYPNEVKIIQDAFPSASIKIVYGSTEAEPISSVSASELIQKHQKKQRGLYVGKIHPDTQLKVISLSNDSIKVNNKIQLESLEKRTGEIGEIIVHGDHVLRQYVSNPEAQQRYKIDCENTFWHRTGDSGYIDELGHLFLTGRCQNLINIDGSMISPFVIEHQLLEIDGISAGTVMSLHSKVIIAIEPSSGSNTNAIKKRVEASFKEVDQVIVVPNIPRDSRHHSKLDYTKLKSMLSA